jgi:hypothetical protein
MRRRLRNLRAVSIVWRMLPLLACVSGCATRALWKETNLDAFNEPADESSLRVFNAERQKDWLLVYDEYSERSDSVRTRAFFLNQNQKRIEQRRRPDFVGTDAMRGLKRMPVFLAANVPGTNLPPLFFILAVTNNLSFTLYEGHHAMGAYAMPVYNDGKARAVRMALTPATVVADLTIVGGYLGYWFICGLAQSGYSGSFH